MFFNLKPNLLVKVYAFVLTPQYAVALCVFARGFPVDVSRCALETT